MRTPRFTLMVSGILVLCAILGLPAGVSAQPLPPPPDKTPIVIPTEAPTEAPTEEPTVEPTAEPTSAPTEEPTEEPTAEPTSAPTEEPTKEPTAEPTSAPTEEPPEENPAADGKGLTASKPAPNCQAVVEGTVTDANGRAIAGAEVSLTGEGLERKLLTGDAGNYGFGGLCAGTVTLVAAMPGGKISPAVTLEVDGKSSFVVNLGFGSDGPEETPITEVVATAVPEVYAAQEPTLPATGFPGIYLLMGVAIVSLLLAITTGIWRTVKAHQDR